MLSRANRELVKRLERIEAVDGRALDLDDDAVKKVVDDEALQKARRAQKWGASTIIHSGSNLVHFDDHLTPGGIACAMSHRLALERIAEHPSAEWGLIIEDDIRAAVPCVDVVLAQLLKRLPADWEAVFLGYHDSQACLHSCAWEVSAEFGGNSADVAARCEELPVEPLTGGVYGLYAWMVTRSAAQKLLVHAFPIAGQVDHALSTWLATERGKSYKVRCDSFLFYSPTSEEEGDSDIQTMKSLSEITDVSRSLHDYVLDQWVALNADDPDEAVEDDDEIIVEVQGERAGDFDERCDSAAADLSWAPDRDLELGSWDSEVVGYAGASPYLDAGPCGDMYWMEAYDAHDGGACAPPPPCDFLPPDCSYDERMNLEDVPSPTEDGDEAEEHDLWGGESALQQRGRYPAYFLDGFDAEDEQEVSGGMVTAVEATE